MTRDSWLRTLTRRRADGRGRRAHLRRWSPSIEVMEGRVVPALLYTVGTSLVVAPQQNEQLEAYTDNTGSTYSFELSSGVFTVDNGLGGFNAAYGSGVGTNQFTLNSAGVAYYTTISIQDSGDNTSLLLGARPLVYSDNLFVLLDNAPLTQSIEVAAANPLQFSGTSSFDLSAKGRVHYAPGASVTTQGDSISAAGNYNSIGASPVGVDVDAGATLQVNGGSGIIDLRGEGQGGGGVLVRSGSSVATTGTGYIYFQGTDTATAGIHLAPGASVTTQGAAISLYGNYTSGTGAIGLDVEGATVRVNGGNGFVDLRGIGIGGGGVLLRSGSSVATTGTGYLAITGTDTGSGDGSDGVRVNGSWNQVISIGGNIAITGTAAGDDGLQFSPSSLFQIAAGGSGSITLSGTSTAGGFFGEGVQMGLTEISTVNGNIQINGATTSDRGVWINAGSTVQSTGTGTIALTSFDGPILLDDTDVSATAAIVLTTIDTAAANDNVLISNGSAVGSAGGYVLLQAGDGLLVDATSSVGAAGLLGVTGDYQDADPGSGTVINLLGTLSGSPVVVIGGLDNDAITLNPVGAPAVLLDGDAGNDAYSVTLGHLTGTASVDDQAGEGTDALTINGTAVADSFTINGGQTQAGSQTVAYTANLESLQVNGLAGNDTFAVTPSPTAVIGINGGSPSAPASPGDTLAFTPPVGQTSTLVNQTASSGTYQTTGGYKNVNYADIETLAAPNQAPVNTVPLSVTTGENVSVAVTGISVSDPDAGSSTVQMTLSVLHGGLAVNSGVIGGLTAGQVSGNNTGTVVLTGTIAQINATLAVANGLFYSPTAGFTGTDVLTVTTNDQGNTGTGGPRTDTDNVTITVLSSLQQVNSLTALVQQYMTAGLLSNGQGTSMINSALKKITETSGIGQIDKFISDVQKLVMQGKLSQANANPLLQAAQAIRAGLTS
jgi:hypothetical protein